MNQVRITGWRAGFQKVGLTKTIQARLGFGLAEAKRCTDLVLEGSEVVLDVPDAEAARSLSLEFKTLGVEVALNL